MLAPVDQLRPIELEEVLRTARLQERVERKYLLPAATAEELVARLAPTHRVLEIAGVRATRYRTVYFDTADLLCYREHVQGRRRRFKCRRRTYFATGHEVLEVKLKACRGRTSKHATQWAAGGCSALDGQGREFLAQRLLDAYGRPAPVELHPVLTNECTRITLVADGVDERVTFDVDVRFRGHSLRPGVVIVETKSPGARTAADEHLRHLGARPQLWCSKYCLGVALERRGVRDNPLRPLLRRHFVPLG